MNSVGRARLEILDERLDPLGEEQPRPELQAGGLHAGPFHDMGQRQVGEDALLVRKPE